MLSATIIDKLNQIIKTVHNGDSDSDFLFSMPAFKEAVVQNNAAQVNTIVSLWVEQRYSGIKNVIKPKSMMKILQSLGINVVSFSDKYFFSNLCPEKNLLSNLTSCHIAGATKTQVLSQILLWSFISRRAHLYILNLINQELQNQNGSETSTEIRLKQGENSLDHLWSWLLSFTKTVSVSVIATFAKLMRSKQLPTDLTSFHCFFMEDALLTSKVCFSWLGMSPMDSVDELVPLERLVPDTPQGNNLKQKKVLLFTASFVSCCLQFISQKNEKQETTEVELSHMLHAISWWKSLTNLTRLSQFISTKTFLNSIPTMNHLCMHECILKELTSKGAEESISPPHLTQRHQFVTKQQSKISDVEKCQFQSKKLTEPIDNFWTEHSVTKTIVKNFFMEMMFFQKKEVSDVSVKEFVCQLEYPPDSNLRIPTIAFLYLLTEQLLSQKREQIMDNPLLPAFKILIDALEYLDRSRNTNVKRKKWSILCDTFYPPQEEDKNQLLHIFLTKCLHGQLPVLNNHGLFDCLTKRYCTTETNSKVLCTKTTGGGHSKTVMTSPGATHLNRARTPASSTGGSLSKTVPTTPAASPSNTTSAKVATKPKNAITTKSNQVSSPCTPGGQEQRVSPRKTVEKRKIKSNTDKKVKMSRKLQ